MTTADTDSARAVDELLDSFQRACEKKVEVGERGRIGDQYEGDIEREHTIVRNTLRETLLQLQRENADHSARWAVFRTAVEAVDAQMRVIASAVADMGEPELAALLRETALRMFMSVQDDSTQATAGTSQPTR